MDDDSYFFFMDDDFNSGIPSEIVRLRFNKRPVC